MKQSYRNSHRDDTEVIKVLTSISIVSGRLARNMSILAAQRQSEEGGRFHEQNDLA